MSQAGSNTPSVVVNTTSNRQQVPLRDYLNARVAPFLKKAITDSLGVEAEYPLQWLGECLIHQSILYEGNPDRTNIRERFLYQFEAPAPQEKPPGTPARSDCAGEQQLEPQPEPQEVAVHEATETGVEPHAPSEASAPQATTLQHMTITNGIEEEEKQGGQDTNRDDDTEMGGIS